MIEAAGVEVGTTSVMLVDSSYVRGAGGVSTDGLFKIVDRTSEVEALLPTMIELNGN